ncbi:MAG: HipA N-terminal domain-containing protein [Gammaproteobacteria bacterium]|nr:HipA N-terminal domain-containing protein [Gammaproteobacteria bacterium]
MRRANVFVNKISAGILEELGVNHFRFHYHENYQGAPVSLTMPIKNNSYEFHEFPSFFEGLLPEGILLEGLLRKYKFDKNDYFGQLLQVGHDVIGAITIEEMR